MIFILKTLFIASVCIVSYKIIVKITVDEYASFMKEFSNLLKSEESE